MAALRASSKAMTMSMAEVLVDNTSLLNNS